MVALHPDPGFRKRLAPVLFDVPAAAGEVVRRAVYGERARDAVIEAEHPVVALHERRKGVRPHDARRGQRDRPGRTARKAQFAGHPAFRPVNVQLDPVGAEMVRPDPDVELVPRGLERLERVAMIRGRARRAVQRLHERVGRARLAADEDAGDDGVTVLLTGIHQLEIPALEKGRPLAAAVVERRPPDAAQVRHDSFSSNAPHRSNAP